MLAKVSETTMHRIRWGLTTGWGLLIASLFYDPVSSWVTHPNRLNSPLRIDPSRCVELQGQCMKEVPYALGTTFFWGIVIPSAIFILLVFGHETWRRICPLSFLSQLPRALGWQRRRVSTRNGIVRHAVPTISKNSWLGRNHTSLQFGLLFIGLCSRILIFSAHRVALGVFLIATIGAAIAVGFLYDGKSWCHYFCPMAPVQAIFAEPRGLVNSAAHIDRPASPITQSMCRTVVNSQEQSACVACQSPCIDIDAERTYWASIRQPQQRWVRYGYVGLVLGYFCYYYLYSGSWDYFQSGMWTHDDTLMLNLLGPGFYLFEQPIAIPKLAAVPLTLGLFTLGSYGLGCLLEKRYKVYQRRRSRPAGIDLIRHRMFTLCTFIAFNLFLVLTGASGLIRQLPAPLPTVYIILIVMVSSFWLRQTWGRSLHRYRREKFAHSLRRQLATLNFDAAKALEGRSLTDLNADEVYVLARVVPQLYAQRQQIYQSVLKEALTFGAVTPAMSRSYFLSLRQELELSTSDHNKALTALCKQHPKLLLTSHRDGWRPPVSTAVLGPRVSNSAELDGQVKP
ncbi:MAG: calcium-binding protein [Elainellaceae cyanobacterium]